MKKFKLFILCLCLVLSFALIFGCAATSDKDSPSGEQTTSTNASGLTPEENNENEENVDFGDLTGNNAIGTTEASSDDMKPSTDASSNVSPTITVPSVENDKESSATEPTSERVPVETTKPVGLEENSKGDDGSFGEWF